MKVKLYHNPRCSKSQLTLKLLENLGINPEVIEYLKNPPSADELSSIIKMLDMPAIKLIRKKEAFAIGLDIDNADENTLISFIVEWPEIFQRPIIIANNRAVIGRPPENIFDII